MARRPTFTVQAMRYLGFAAPLHFGWESAQLPLYTIWRDGSAKQIAFALLHCTAGDVLITAVALALAAGLAELVGWRLFGVRMAVAAIGLGLAYTVFSEWLNVSVRRSWADTEMMPLLPPLGTGLAPFLQWIVVPGIAWLCQKPVPARRS